MNDIIKPFDFDLTKKLHGHVRVETRSRWTGRVVDSQEKDNLITDGLQAALTAAAWCAGSNWQTSGMQFFAMPIYAKALGGLMIFDGALTESASNVNIPSSVKIVGAAGQDANTDSAIIGSYNGQESVFVSNGFTTVWDFLTSQANGTIASLARTSHLFASAPAYYYYSGNQIVARLAISSLSSISLSNFYIMGYDETNHYLYCFPSSNQTIEGVTYSRNAVYKAKVYLDKFGVAGGVPPASQLTLVKTFTSADGSTSPSSYYYDKWSDNFIYLSGNTLHLVSASDGTHTTKTLSGSGSYFASTEHYYWRGDGSSKIYRYAKTNVADVGEYNIGGYYFAPMENDIMCAYALNPSRWVLCYPDGNSIDFGYIATIGGNMAKCGPFYSSNGYDYLLFKPGYLGTIANLDSPVTKTSSQTMKITYTLTEA